MCGYTLLKKFQIRADLSIKWLVEYLSKTGFDSTHQPTPSLQDLVVNEPL